MPNDKNKFDVIPGTRVVDLFQGFFFRSRIILSRGVSGCEANVIKFALHAESAKPFVVCIKLENGRPWAYDEACTGNVIPLVPL